MKNDCEKAQCTKGGKGKILHRVCPTFVREGVVTRDQISKNVQLNYATGKQGEEGNKSLQRVPAHIRIKR